MITHIPKFFKHYKNGDIYSKDCTKMMITYVPKSIKHWNGYIYSKQ